MLSVTLCVRSYLVAKSFRFRTIQTVHTSTQNQYQCDQYSIGWGQGGIGIGRLQLRYGSNPGSSCGWVYEARKPMPHTPLPPTARDIVNFQYGHFILMYSPSYNQISIRYMALFGVPSGSSSHMGFLLFSGGGSGREIAAEVSRWK